MAGTVEEVRPPVTITACEGFVDRANARAGQTVLIQAGAGGIGHIAIQIARARVVEVFATVLSCIICPSMFPVSETALSAADPPARKKPARYDHLRLLLLFI
jgi:hypothetical protein